MQSNSWLSQSLIAATALAGMLLLLRRLGGGLPPLLILAWLFALGALFSAGWVVISGGSLRIGTSSLGGIALAALCSVLGNAAYVRAIAAAPNPGFPVAIEGGKAVLVLLVAALIWGDPVGNVKFVGCALCIAGVILIAL